MNAATKKYYENRGKVLVKNLKSRHFDACYCDNKEQALEKALELIPADAVIGWGGATSAQQIGLMETLNAKGYHTLDRDKVSDMAEKVRISKQCLLADVFLTGANAISLDGQITWLWWITRRKKRLLWKQAGRKQTKRKPQKKFRNCLRARSLPKKCFPFRGMRAARRIAPCRNG